MGYKNALIRIDLAHELDADEYDGLWVVLRNPKIQPPAKLTPPDVEVGEDGRPKHMADALLATATMQAGLIFDWNLPDPADPAGEDAESMPIYNRGKLDQGPVAEDVAKMPAGIFTHITKIITAAINPQ